MVAPFQVLSYTIVVVTFINTQEKYMDANATIEAVKVFCKANSGDTQIWSGNKATYHWNIGKVTGAGIVNGVVRKLAGIDSGSGQQIWVVAGSFKIISAIASRPSISFLDISNNNIGTDIELILDKLNSSGAIIPTPDCE
jgi:hypothetical protein